MPGIAKQPGRRRRSRSLIPAYVSGGLVVASAVAVLALTKPGSTTCGGYARPAAGSRERAGRGAGHTGEREPRASAKSSAKPSGKSAPSVFVTPVQNQAVTPSVLRATVHAQGFREGEQDPDQIGVADPDEVCDKVGDPNPDSDADRE